VRHRAGVFLLPSIATLRAFLDRMDDWAPDPPEPGEVGLAAEEQREADALEDPAKPGTPPHTYPVVDLEARAAGARYRGKLDKRTGKRLPGKLKRGYYAPVTDFRKRRIVIGLHQAGVVRSEARWMQTAGGVTCHRAIGPTGVRYRVHPLCFPLVATNRFNRDPWHCLAIEVLNNLKGSPKGDWYKPDTFGRGTLGLAQATALQQEIVALCEETEALGGEVVGIVPHRIAGVASNGKPNRQICCGYEVWQAGGEWAGAKLGLAVPREGWHVGGLPIPSSWHGPLYPECARTLP
jgi:hypothetical protein